MSNFDGRAQEVNRRVTPVATDHVLDSIVSIIDGIAFDELLISSRGWVRYIDFIKPTDFNEKIARGVCPSGRPFVAFRLERIHLGNQPQRIVETAFRRYATRDIWCTGGEKSVISSGRIDSQALARIAALCRGCAIDGWRLA